VSGDPARLTNRPDAAPEAAAVVLERKVRFLSSPEAYPHRPPEVLVKETHMSWVFLAGDRVFKMKKPVRYPHLDFASLEARESNCREEVRLNARLAPHTYLGVMPLRMTADGRLTLEVEGEVVDWLVRMRRLPEERMLDRLIAQGSVMDTDLDRLAEVLTAFYTQAEPADIPPSTYAYRFAREQAANRDVLSRRSFAVDHGRVPAVLDRLDAAIAQAQGLLEDRLRAGRILEGHGDLRPEHICLSEPLVIFDCLEFNRDLRLVDPFDELAFLGMECSLLGAPWLGPALMDRLAVGLGSRPPETVIRFYTAFRAVVRARLALAHLLDAIPREPAKWEPLATRYLLLAEGALDPS
jgi:aminoglycoside phosphotransferase family enzyme